MKVIEVGASTTINCISESEFWHRMLWRFSSIFQRHDLLISKTKNHRWFGWLPQAKLPRQVPSCCFATIANCSFILTRDSINYCLTLVKEYPGFLNKRYVTKWCQTACVISKLSEFDFFAFLRTAFLKCICTLVLIPIPEAFYHL